MLRARPNIERVLPRTPDARGPGAALDLASIDPPVWHVLSRDKAHGPFTLGQLKALADRGKIAPSTRVSSGDGQPFLPAQEHAVLRARIEAFAQSRQASLAQATNFVIMSGPAAGSGTARRHALGAALNGLGRFAEPMPGMFVLRSNKTLGDVRRALTAAAPEGTQLMIFESRDARLGWAGLSMASADAVRAVWDARLDPATE